KLQKKMKNASEPMNGRYLSAFFLPMTPSIVARTPSQNISKRFIIVKRDGGTTASRRAAMPRKAKALKIRNPATRSASSTWVSVKWVSANIATLHGRAVPGPRPSWYSSVACRRRQPSKLFRKSNQVLCSPIVRLGTVVAERVTQRLDGDGEKEDGQPDGESDRIERQEADREEHEHEQHAHLQDEEELEQRALHAVPAQRRTDELAHAVEVDHRQPGADGDSDRDRLIE